MHKTKFINHMQSFGVGIAIFFLQVNPSFAYDSRDIVRPNGDHQVLCPISPDLKNTDQCIQVTGDQLGLGVRTSFDLGIYTGHIAYTRFNALCEKQGAYSDFSGFAQLGSTVATGRSGDHHVQFNDFYCCKRIAKWVSAGTCDALKVKS